MTTEKTLNAALKAAFMAGAKFGSRYPEPNSWPAAEQDVQFDAWRSWWNGYAWDPSDWLLARTAKGLAITISRGVIAGGKITLADGTALFGETAECNYGCDPRAGRHHHG